MFQKWLLCFVLWVSANATWALEVTGFTADKVITYKEIGDVTLRLHLFFPSAHLPSDKRPAIVFFFGGGWTGGSPTQFFPHCAHLASRGMVAMAAEYRVKTAHGTTPKECVKDGKSAVRWLRENAMSLGINPNKVAAGGGSAGGHVAAAAGTLKGFDEDRDDVTVSARPDALVLFNPVFDNGPGGWGHETVKDYWEAISPLHNIDTKTPPTVVFLGTEDPLVPTATAEAFKQRLTDQGVRCDLHLYEGQKHGFFNYQHLEYYEKTIAEMDRFLLSEGFLSEAP